MDLLSHLREFEGFEVRGYDSLQPDLGDLQQTCPRLFVIDHIHAALMPPSATRKVAAFAVVILAIVGAVLWSWVAVLVAGIAHVILLFPEHVQVQPKRFEDLWVQFTSEERIGEVQALVIGPWFMEVDEGPSRLLASLIRDADKLTGLRAIFLGDIIGEECEISWIEQGNLTPLLDAYPNLESLVVRGASNLRFEGLEHDNLHKLVVQSGGLAPETIADLAQSSTPALEHLELWLGEETYGFDSSVDELRPLWQPTQFPALQTLALRNCSIADEVAAALSTQPEAVTRLSHLDLSLGTLSDLGAQSLFNNPAVLTLDSLDVHYHYLSDDWAEKLRSMPIEVDASEGQGYADPEDEDERYVAVSE